MIWLGLPLEIFKTKKGSIQTIELSTFKLVYFCECMSVFFLSLSSFFKVLTDEKVLCFSRDMRRHYGRVFCRSMT